MCNKCMVSAAIWLAGMCAFPPLVPSTEISLQRPGLILESAFKVPVDKSYLLGLYFEFPSEEAGGSDELVGATGSYKGNRVYCNANVDYADIPADARQGLGLPIPFKVVIRRQLEGTVVLEQVFNSLCKTSHGGKRKGRDIGRVKLDRGNYRIELYNQQAQPAFAHLTTRFHLVSGGPK